MALKRLINAGALTKLTSYEDQLKQALVADSYRPKRELQFPFFCKGFINFQFLAYELWVPSA